jgi:UDP-N-acetylglucosamine 2-epimerase (non-hydrolysing)
MSSFSILLVAGTRPNFIKLAPLFHTLNQQDWCAVSICHTGQHYDKNMSDIFWEYLELPSPKFSLGIRAGSVPEAIGATTVAIAKVLQENHFDLVVVFGDVNGTVAGAIAAVQLGIKVMHVEAGLRSFDRSMPEEVNRVITDHISNFLMVSEPSGMINLEKEGIDNEMVHFVGNIMIESLINFRPRWESIALPDILRLVVDANFIVATFHRPENVDCKENLSLVVNRLLELSQTMPIVFPIHPRAKAQLELFGLFELLSENNRIILLPPLGYFEFIKLVSLATLVATDSGGIQEETTFLGKACVTLRKNTERPITISQGTNLLLDLNQHDFVDVIKEHIIFICKKKLEPVMYWDNRVSHRIAKLIKENCVVKSV